MIAYGEKKRGSAKLHGHDKCFICAEKNILKKSARQDAKKEIKKELNMLKITGEDEIRTNHIMIAGDKKRIYCRLLNKIIKWSDEFFQENCYHCQYLNGLGQNIGTIECAFNDGSENITEVVEDPFSFVESGYKLGFKML